MSHEAKKRKPNKTDKSVFMKYGKTGKYTVSELMSDYETFDYNNLPEAKATHVELDESSAVDLFSILTHKPLKRKAEFADSQKQKRLMALYQSRGVLSDEQRKELDMEQSSEAEEYVALGDDMLSGNEESSESDTPLSTLTLPTIDWTLHTPYNLANYNRISLFGANSVDEEVDMELGSQMGKVQSVEEWKSLLEGQMCARFRGEEDAGHGKMYYFELKKCFVALYLLPSKKKEQLVNYLFLAPAKTDEYDTEEGEKLQ